MPSSAAGGQRSEAWSLTSCFVFPMATPVPTARNIGMSFLPSPKAMASSRERPKCRRIAPTPWPLPLPFGMMSTARGHQAVISACSVPARIRPYSSFLAPIMI